MNGKHFYRHGRHILVFAVAICLLMPSAVSARLLVLPPQQVISSSDLIVEATVTANEVEGNQRAVTLEIFQTLQGDAQPALLNLTLGMRQPHNQAPADFPVRDSRVLVCLSQSEEQYHLTSDLNSIALLKDGRVQSVFAGAVISLNESKYTPEDYLQAYQTLYDEQALPYYEETDAVNPQPWWLSIFKEIKGLWA